MGDTPSTSETYIDSLSFPFPLPLSFVGRVRCRVELSGTSGGVSSAWAEVARETIASSESRGRRAGSKSDRACDDEAVASGGTMGSEGGATTARLRAEARWDLLLSTLLTWRSAPRRGSEGNRQRSDSAKDGPVETRMSAPLL